MITASNSSNADAFLPITSKEFATYTIEDFIGFGTNVVTHVTGFAPVAAIKPPVPEVKAGMDDLISKNGAAMNGGRTERMDRNLSHKASVGQMRQWASYIDSIAEGDRMLILECGFQLRRASTPSTVPAIPGNVRVAYSDKSGEALLRCKGGRNVRNFSIQYSESADGPWIDRPLTTKARGTVVPGLTPGKMYWFRMRANGAAGSSDWSMPACKMAL
jgi:hypothetical protein